MKNLLGTKVVSTPFDGESGGLGVKRLLIVVAALIVIGGLVIYAGQAYFGSRTAFEATVVYVGKGIATVTLEGSEPGDEDYASFPDGMELKPGDTVRIRVDVEEGNSVEEVLED